MTMPDLSSIMQGGSGIVGAFNKHSQIGASVAGTITELDIVQLNDYITKQPKTWDDGKPQLQIRVVLQADTGTWTPQSEDDTGQRSLHIKTWGIHLKTFRDAIQAAGQAEPVLGGHLAARFDREETSTQGSPTKVIEYQYQPPASDVAQAMNGQQPTPQAAPQQQQPQQQYQQPPQAQPVQQAPQQPVAPVAPPQGQTMATPQGQVDPNTGELTNYATPVPAQQAAPQQQAPQDPWSGQPAPQQPQAQQVPQAGPAPGAGMDSNIMKLVQAGLDDATILQTLGAQGVTPQQVQEVRKSFG